MGMPGFVRRVHLQEPRIGYQPGKQLGTLGYAGEVEF
jgi:hypothetical protein